MTYLHVREHHDSKSFQLDLMLYNDKFLRERQHDSTALRTVENIKFRFRGSVCWKKFGKIEKFNVWFILNGQAGGWWKGVRVATGVGC